jgi:hypothetical protein
MSVAPIDQSRDSNLITVMIASGRVGLLQELLPRLASEQDIKMLSEPVEDPALLPRCVEQRQPKVLLLDKGVTRPGRS